MDYKAVLPGPYMLSPVPPHNREWMITNELGVNAVADRSGMRCTFVIMREANEIFMRLQERYRKR